MIGLCQEWGHSELLFWSYSFTMCIGKLSRGFSVNKRPQVNTPSCFPHSRVNVISVLPGFAPAGEALLFRQKGPKPMTPRLASIDRMDANLRRTDQLAPLKQGPPAEESVPPLGQTAGVEPRKTNLSMTDIKERGPYILYDPRNV
jgi:hypothetical protein